MKGILSSVVLQWLAGLCIIRGLRDVCHLSPHSRPLRHSPLTTDITYNNISPSHSSQQSFVSGQLDI